MQSHSPTSNWNPQLAIGVVAVGLIAAVWLNMAKLKMGLGQPQHDISQVPIARNITSDEIEQMRNGKPLALILAEQADYSKLAKTAEARQDVASSQASAVPQPIAETTTAYQNHRRAAGERPAVNEAAAPAAAPPDAGPAIHPASQEKSGFRLPFQDPAIEPVAFEDSPPANNRSGQPDREAPGNEPTPVGSPIAPQSVPRANPAGESAGSPGGSFLEKFPGQSQHLPNVKHGPAIKPVPQPLMSEPTAQRSSAPLPNAAELSPPPFGDWAPRELSSAPSAPSFPTTAFQPSATKPSPQVLSETPERFEASSPSPIGLPEREPAPTLDIQTENESKFPVISATAGDTWWSLAQRAYDDGRHFRDLYAYNRDCYPEYSQIPVGAQIVCPPVEVLKAGAHPASLPAAQEPALVDHPHHTTREGETLFGIARQQLGQASRFVEIMELNRSRLPRNSGHLTPLPAGIELRLPHK